MQAPDKQWLDFLKIAFGFMLLALLAGLAGLIALGKVEQQTSHGLDIILGAISVISGQYALWAFKIGNKE
jgi:hypothetical protein